MSEPVAPASPTPHPKRRGGLVVGILVGGTLLLLGGAYGVGYALSGETLAPKTTIEGVPVGGLSPAEAEAKLTAELGPRASEALVLTAGDQSLTKLPEEYGLALDAAASVAATRTEKSFHPLDIWESLTGGRAHEAVVTREEDKLDAAASELGQLVNVDPVNAELIFEETTPVVKEAAAGRTLNVESTKTALADGFLASTQVAAVVDETPAEITTEEAQAAMAEVATPAMSAPITITAGEQTFEIAPSMVAASLSFTPTEGDLTPTLDPDALMKQASTVLKGLGLKEPQDATFVFSNGRPTIVPSVDGMGVGKEQLAEVVRAAMVKPSERTGTVEVAPQKASFTTEDAEKLGIKEITGEFTTRFPATAYRITNIGKSAGLVNGTLVKPGEVFSMNQVLGPRTLARGWAAGGAIDGGRVVERMGGGISQTTTTTFNAIFFAGLEDVYHKPHSLYFDRYPMGREATLDYHSVDMKFKNNTDYGVLMQAFTNNPSQGGQGTITVRVWSTKTYDVKASDPVKSNVRSPGATIKDGGAVCTPQSGMEGFTVSFNRLFYQGGSLVRSEPFTWTYNTLTPVECTNPNARRDRIER